jgi:hypothetical protein
MKPLVHAETTAKRFGGKPEDYQEIHDFMDMSKAGHADMRHRMFLHHSMGPYLAEKVFGIFIVNSDGDKVSVRDIAEHHILEDLGRIPSFSEWCGLLPLEEWMGQPRKITKVYQID